MGKFYDPYAEFKEYELANGLKVYYLYRSNHPWLAVGMVIHAGASSDPQDLSGVAHFVEHLASDNVPGYKASDIENFFTELGGQVYLGSTSFFSTRYKFFIPASTNVLRKAGDIFGQMLFGHDLTVEVEVERGIILQEYRKRFELDYQLEWMQKATQELSPGFWNADWITPLGNPKTVGAITHSDLENFYRIWYTPANTSLVVVGGMEDSEVIKVLSQSALARPKDGGRQPLPTPLVTVPPPSSSKIELHFGEYSNIPIDYLDYAYAICLPGRYCHASITEVARKMLCSILFDELREKRSWTYSTRAYSNCFGSFSKFWLEAEKVSLTALPDIEGVVGEIIESLPNRQKLFDQNKKIKVKSYELHDVNDRTLCDNAIDDLTDRQKIVTFAELMEELHSLTVADLAEFCSHLQPHRALTIIKSQ